MKHKISSPDSSFIASAEYNDASQELKVIFNNGIEFIHKEVPAHVFKEYESAESKGRFYVRHLKGKYS